MEQLQRPDITTVVAKYSAATTKTARIAEAEPPPMKAPGPKPKKPYTKKMPATAKPWYLVVDEIVEGTVTIEAWPWPEVDPATRFLKFDLKQARSKTLDLSTLQERINALREETEEDPVAALRALRIGDVFQVEASNIGALATWRRVIDDTEGKRRDARAALHAMAAPVLDPETAGELEEVARASQRLPNAVHQIAAGQAFPAV